MAYGKSLELREITIPEPGMYQISYKERPIPRRAQRFLRNSNPTTTRKFTRRSSGVATGPGALTKYHVEISETGIQYFMARPFAVRRPGDWGRYEARKAAMAAGIPPVASVHAEPMTFRSRQGNYKRQMGPQRGLSARQCKRLRLKQNRAGHRQRQAAGLAA